MKKYDAVMLRERDIDAGQPVHTHNLTLEDFDRDPDFGTDMRPVDYVPQAERATFMDIVRPDGPLAGRPGG